MRHAAAKPSREFVNVQASRVAPAFTDNPRSPGCLYIRAPPCMRDSTTPFTLHQRPERQMAIEVPTVTLVSFHVARLKKYSNRSVG
jgi:hypothetical protein